MNDDLAELEAIDGVGPSVADDLRSAGFEHAEDVATADQGDLEGVSTYVANRAGAIQASATAIIDEQSQTTDESGVDDVSDADDESNVDDVSDADDASEISDVSDDDGPTVLEVTFSIPEPLYYHTLAAILEEMVRCRQRNNEGGRESMATIAETMINARASQGEGDVDVELTVTMDELNLIHQALSSRINDYRRRAGLPSLWGELKTVLDEVQEHRVSNIGA